MSCVCNYSSWRSYTMCSLLLVDTASFVVFLFYIFLFNLCFLYVFCICISLFGRLSLGTLVGDNWSEPPTLPRHLVWQNVLRLQTPWSQIWCPSFVMKGAGILMVLLDSARLVFFGCSFNPKGTRGLLTYTFAILLYYYCLTTVRTSTGSNEHFLIVCPDPSKMRQYWRHCNRNQTFLAMPPDDVCWYTRANCWDFLVSLRPSRL